MTDSAIVSDPLRVPITAQRRDDGTILLCGYFKNLVILSPSEVGRLIEFANDAPRLGELRRFPVPLKTPLSATQAGE